MYCLRKSKRSLGGDVPLNSRQMGLKHGARGLAAGGLSSGRWPAAGCFGPNRLQWTHMPRNAVVLFAGVDVHASLKNTYVMPPPPMLVTRRVHDVGTPGMMPISC